MKWWGSFSVFSIFQASVSLFNLLHLLFLFMCHVSACFMSLFSVSRIRDKATGHSGVLRLQATVPSRYFFKFLHSTEGDPPLHLWGFSRPNCPAPDPSAGPKFPVSSSLRTLKTTERMCTGVQDTEVLVWGWYWASRAIMKSNQAEMSWDGFCPLLVHDIVLSL